MAEKRLSPRPERERPEPERPWRSEPEPEPKPELTWTPEPEPSLMPESFSTAEPEPERTFPYPEPENSSVPEPEATVEPFGMITGAIGTPEPEAEGEPEPAAGAEPVPEWPSAMAEWEEAWEVHIYMLGAAFLLLAVLSIASIILAKRKVFRASLITCPTLIMLALLGTTRTVYLYGDAYGAYKRYPSVIVQMLHGVALPALTSAYGLLLQSLVSALQVKMLLADRRREIILWIIIVVHWTISMTADGLIAAYPESTFAAVFSVICQCIFVVWGLFLAAGFTWTGCKISRRLDHGGRVSKYSSCLLLGCCSSDAPRSKRYTAVRRVVILTYATSVSAISLAAIYLYGIFGVFSVLEDNKVAEPWPWWSYQTLARVAELMMGYLMLFTTGATGENMTRLQRHVSTKTFRGRKSSAGQARSHPAVASADTVCSEKQASPVAVSLAVTAGSDSSVVGVESPLRGNTTVMV